MASKRCPEVYCFDIDGTLCSNTEGDYERAQPHPGTIALVGSLYDAGHRIILHTARGSTTGIDWRDLTERQLQSWGVLYHELVMGKPGADIYIDDKATNVREWLASHATQQSLPDSGQDRGGRSVLTSPDYLDVTYSVERAPYGKYPYQLGEWLLQQVYKRSGRLLDLGCGRGEHMAVFRDLGFDVAGMDISPRAPELATGFHVEVADLEKDPFPYPPNSFDYVFSKSVVEHMHHPECLLQKGLEALRPGGIAVIMTPSWEHNYWGPFYIDYTHVTPFTAPSLADALTIAGYESVTARHFYQLPFLWRYPLLKPVVWLTAALPLPYRPYRPAAPWPEALNKLIRFSKEVMLMGIARKPQTQDGTATKP